MNTLKEALVVENVVVDALVVENLWETLLEKRDLEREALVKRSTWMVGRTLLRWNLDEIGEVRGHSNRGVKLDSDLPLARDE